MKCAVCDMRLKSPAKVEDTPVRIHKKCLNNDLIESIKHIFIGYLYRRNGDLVKGYFHKQHEKL
jgi:hypothetical protein